MLKQCRIKEIQSIKKLRKLLGLRECISKKRICLRCDKKFLSFDIGNRICSSCIKTVIKYNGGVGTYKFHGKLTDV